MQANSAVSKWEVWRWVGRGAAATTPSNTVVTCEIRLFRKLFQPSSTSVWNTRNFISARGNVPEIISKLFQSLIAAREYFSTCSMSL